MNIGILALQGDYARHASAVTKLGHQAVLVKDAFSLQTCDRLIIPGGESTTFLHLIEKLELREALLEFGGSKPVMGTCAGLIVLGKSSEKLPFPPLELIDITVNRNAYGRQVDSFVDNIQMQLNGKTTEFEGVFIRAPKIAGFGPSVKAVAELKGEVVMAENDHILVASFHPELTDDLSIHKYFIDIFAN